MNRRIKLIPVPVLYRSYSREVNSRATLARATVTHRTLHLHPEACNLCIEGALTLDAVASVMLLAITTKEKRRTWLPAPAGAVAKMQGVRV